MFVAPTKRKIRLMPDYGPLQGITVIDSARYVAGPWASTYLGEFGAQVIHIEGPPFGPPYSDPTRTLPPILPVGAAEGNGVSESWVQYARNKLSLGLDLRSSEGRRVFLDLVRRANIWIESSRPGTYPKLGITDEDVWAANPRLTIVHISGYGQTGVPERVRAPSFDLTGQAFSGYLSLQGKPEPDPPTRAGTAINDTVTGLAAAGAALMGYIHSERTGRGQAVDVAQYEVFFMLLENLALDYFVRGVIRQRAGNAHARLHPYDLFRAKNGWVVVAAPTQDSWNKLRDLVGITDPTWDDPNWRRSHRGEVDGVLAEFCLKRSLEELEALGRTHDLAISRVYDIAEIANDPHYQARGMFVEWDDPVAGKVKGAGVAPRFSETPGGVWRGAPWLGQDNERVLREFLGYSKEQVARLESQGTVGSSPPRNSAQRPLPHSAQKGRS